MFELFSHLIEAYESEQNNTTDFFFFYQGTQFFIELVLRLVQWDIHCEVMNITRGQK